MGLLAEKFDLIEPMRNFIKSGKPIFGTCAGFILLSIDFVDETIMVFINIIKINYLYAV